MKTNTISTALMLAGIVLALYGFSLDSSLAAYKTCDDIGKALNNSVMYENIPLGHSCFSQVFPDIGRACYYSCTSPVPNLPKIVLNQYIFWGAVVALIGFVIRENE
jgi:hypothetical protein